MPVRSTNTSPNNFQPNNVSVPPPKSPPPATDSSSVKNNKRIAENKSVANKVVKQEAEEVPANTEVWKIFFIWMRVGEQFWS